MQEKHSLQQKRQEQGERVFGYSRPTGKCVTQEAYDYDSEDVNCNRIWKAWDQQCAHFWSYECQQADDEVQLVPPFAAFPTFACDTGYFGKSED